MTKNLKNMDSRKIKLELSVNLINTGQRKNLLDTVKDVMNSFKEVGNFIGQQITKKSLIDTLHEKESYAIQYENCTLDIDLISDTKTQSQFVQRFQLR